MRAWHANLSLQFRAQPTGKTVLAHMRHEGPLRVQRAFYPRNTDACHVYWLHPPGGLVNGDRLEIAVEAQANSNVLLTTPSAGRIYRSLGEGLKQRQHVHLQLDANALLEWLPQETLIFDGADTELSLRIDCTASSRFLAWDIVCLGRPASHDLFTQGQVRQSIEIWRDDRCVYNERWRIAGDDDVLHSAFGWQGFHTQGCLLAQIALSDTQLQGLRDTLGITQGECTEFSATQRLGIVIVRYLGNSVAQARAGFTRAWIYLGGIGQQRIALPRIWAT